MSLQVYLVAAIRSGIHHSFGGRDMEPQNREDRSGRGYSSDFTFDHMVEYTALDLRLTYRRALILAPLCFWYPARYHLTALMLV
jgi:hypothetical protein